MTPIVPTRHWRFGGSTAGQWLNCDGWLATVLVAPKIETQEMKEGTHNHAVAQAFVLGKYDLAALSPSEYHHAVAWAELVKPSEGWEVEVECELIEGVAGTTLDGVLYDEMLDTLHLADLKTGDMRVFPFQNEQLLFGAVAWMKKSGIRPQRFQLYIVQAVANDDQPATHIWGCDLATVETFEARIRPAIDRNHKATRWEVNLHPKCGFCQGRADCKGHQGALQYVTSGAAVGVMIADLPDPARTVKTLTPEQIGKILAVKKHVEAMFRSCEKLALSIGGVPGFKVGATKPRAVWKLSEEETEAALQELGVPPFELRSPPSAKKSLAELYGKKKAADAIARLTLIPEGTPKIVSDSGDDEE
jgi:hypothetical protein